MRIIKDRKVYSISEVNYFARQTLEQIVLWVEGEISTLRKNPNWNFYYLDLKDDMAVLPAIANGSLCDELEGNLIGQKVIAYGYLSLYEPTGKYQFRIEILELAGEGQLYKKLQMLIQKLEKEGLFDQKFKKDLPLYPKKICLVTSKGSDAWNDFKTHSSDKYPIIKLTTVDVRVQGPESVSQLLKILPKIDKEGFDVIVITRGGGSLHDLAAFNDEVVARAIFKMKTPTVVAIGHEANESLAEWVADKRASTPTDAANIVTYGYTQFLEKLEGYKYKLRANANYYFQLNFQTLDDFYQRMQRTKAAFKDLPHRLETLKENLRRHEKYLISDTLVKSEDFFAHLKRTSKLLIATNKQKLANIQKALELLSPKNTLSRGYSITMDSKGKIINSIKSVVVGSTVGVKLTDGSFTSIVKSKN